MGQFMGYASYDLKTRCEICGEVGPREDMDDHELYCSAKDIESKWKKRTTRIRLSEEPYPEAEIECEDCEQVWQDTEEPTCLCEEGDEE